MTAIDIRQNLDAAREVLAKTAVRRAVYDAMLPEIRARAICISGVQDLDAVQRVRDAIAELPRGADWRQVRNEVVAEISDWLVNPDADADARRAQEREARNRAELLLRTHGFQAYAATRYRAQMDPRSGSGYLRYSTQGDTRVRPEHAALDGLILPKNDPFWRTHYPPWGHGCRCIAIEMENAEVGRIGAAEADLPPDRRTVLDDTQLSLLNKSSRLIRNGRAYALASRTGGGAYTWQPGQAQVPLDAVMRRYDDETGRAFSRAMRAATLAPAARGPGRENVWDLMYGELRDRDLAALVERERRGTAIERATARDIDLAREVGDAVDGSRNQVHVGPLLKEARRSGKRISILHNHPSGDVRPSPRDVALLVGSHDVVAEVGIGGRSIGASGFKSSVMRLGRNTTPSGRDAALRQIRGMLDDKGALAVPAQTWQSYFDRLVKHGVLSYVQQ